MVKFLRWTIAALFVCVSAFGQQTNIRWDAIADTTTGVGQMLPMLALPGAYISFYQGCTALPCTTPAVTYASATSSTACSSTTQVVWQLPLSQACSAVADSQGNFGGYFQPGAYQYTITVSGHVAGPFYFNVGGGGGGGAGCSFPATTSDGQMLYTIGTGCASSPNIHVHNPTSTQDPATASKALFFQNVTSGGTDDTVNLQLTSALHNSEFSTFAPHLWQMSCSNSGRTSLGCEILMQVDDFFSTNNTKIGPIELETDITQPGNLGAIGVNVQEHLDATVTNPTSVYEGVEIDGPDGSGVNTIPSIFGFYSALNGGSEATVEQVGYLAETATGPNGVPIASNYCDFVGREHSTGTPQIREQLGCGPTFISTFKGPVTVPNLTVTGTCTGCSAGGVTTVNSNPGALQLNFSAGAGSCSLSGGTTTCTMTGSGTGGGSVTNFVANTGSWPTWLAPSVATSTTTPTLSVAASTIPVSAGGTGTTTPGLVAGSNISITGTWPNQTVAASGLPSGTVTNFSASSWPSWLTPTVTNSTTTPLLTVSGGTVPIANGGTGTTTPGLVAGTNVSISGSWPNQTISSVGGGGGGTITGSGTTGKCTIFTGSTAIGNGHCDDGVTTLNTYTFTEDLQINDGSGVGGGEDASEGTAHSGSTSFDSLWADSTSHRWVMSNNNGIATPVAGMLTGTTGTITGTALSNSCDSGTVSVTGAQVGKPVSVSTTDGSDVGGAFNIRGSVATAGIVTVYVCGNGTPASKTYNVAVIQ